MKSVLNWLALVLIVVLAGEAIARYFMSGSLDCLLPSADRELLYASKPGAYESDGWLVRMPDVHIQIDADGCRYMPHHAADNRQPTVLFTGDSNTFGLGVGDADAFPAIVEDLVRGHGAADVTVANCAVMGYTFSQVARASELRLRQLRPQLLVLVVNASDLETPVDFSSLSPRGAVTKFAISHSRLARMAYIVGRIFPLWLERRGVPPYLSPEAIRDDVTRVSAAARESHSQVVVLKLGDVVHPSLSFDDVLAAAGLRAFSLPNIEKVETLADGEHWTAAGNRTIAAQVAAFVEEALARAPLSTYP